MLKRLRASPWVRAGLLAVVLACCGYGLHAEWPQMHAALGRLHWYSVAASALAAMAGAGCTLLAWREILADLGSRLPVPAAVRAGFLAQLAKYVPGAVWAFAAQVELGHDYEVPRRRGATSVAVALAVTVGVGLAVAAAALPLADGAAAGQYLWFLALIPAIAVCLYPPVLARLVNTALRLIRQEPLEHPLSLRGLGRAIAWTIAGWLCLGVQVWLVLASLTTYSPKLLLLSTGAFALAFSAALLLLVFPGGIGAREVILIAVLAPVVPRGTAVAVAILVRLTTTASDLAWGGVALPIGRTARGRTLAHTPAHARPRPARGPGGRARSGRVAGAAQPAEPQVDAGPVPDPLTPA
jgi:hypothetical protein